MMTIASRSGDNRIARSQPGIQAAHFDIAVASAGDVYATLPSTVRPVNLLADRLSPRKRMALLSCVPAGVAVLKDLRQSAAISQGRAVQKVVALAPESQSGGHDDNHPGGYPDPIFYTATKLLCLDDLLFNLDGGSDFVQMSVAAARRAGRMTALLCSDLSTAFKKRREIVDCFGGRFDIVVGEPAAVLSLFELKRIDTLVPKLVGLGTGLVLHRVDFPPIHVRPQSAVVEVGETPLSANAFWSQFVPSAFDAFLTPDAGRAA